MQGLKDSWAKKGPMKIQVVKNFKKVLYYFLYMLRC